MIETRDNRRYDIRSRAYDGKWVVWQRFTPPQFISMEWRAIHIADSRKAAFRHMWELVDNQQQEVSP